MRNLVRVVPTLTLLAGLNLLSLTASGQQISDEAAREENLYRVELLLFRPLESQIDEAGLEDMANVPIPQWQRDAGPVIWGPSWNESGANDSEKQDTPNGAEQPIVQSTQSPESEPVDANEKEPVDRTLLPEEELTLTTARDRLIRSGRYKPLMLIGWKEAFPPGHGTPPLTIRIGDHYRDHYEVEGTIQIKRRRYLHVNAELFDLSLPSEEDRIPEAPAWSPLRQTETIGDTGMASSDDPLAALNFDVTEWRAEPQTEIISWLRETRRMRSEELHLLDAPTLELLVYFEPIEPEADAVSGTADTPAAGATP
ncbi:CsiV family protein [Marinobacteraceae bacterium S3BR75-40.1]